MYKNPSPVLRTDPAVPSSSHTLMSYEDAVTRETPARA